MSENNDADETKIIRMPDIQHKPDHRGIGYVFFTKMVQHQDRIAQIDGLTGKTDTYRSLLQRCVRTAITIRSKGVTPDDIVTLCTLNHFNSCVPFIATLFIGAKTSCLDPSLSISDTVHLLKQITPKIIFVSSEARNLIKEALKQLPEPIETIVFGQADFLIANDGEGNFKPIEVSNDRDTAMIFCSSGTSGLPKAHVVRSFGFCYDIILNFSSLYWVSPVFCLGMAILTGSTRVVVPKFEVKTVWDVIEKCKPTLICSAPNPILAMAMAMENHPHHLDISSLKHIWIGGAPLVKKHILTIRKAIPNVKLVPSYGQTEVAMISTMLKPNDPDECVMAISKPTCCGKGVPGMSYKIVNPDTEELLGPNQPGELRLKSELLLNGYHKFDCSEIWDADGWFKTGDVLYYDEEGCFYVVDRIKEMLRFKGWQVPPTLLEEVLLTHPAIANCVVIGLPHEEDGDHPMAVVVLKEASSSVTAKEIETYVEQRVDDRKRLRGGVKIVGSIPAMAIGKVARRRIKAMILRGEL